MKMFANRTQVTIIVVTFFSLLLLVGCVSTKQKLQDDLMAKGIKVKTEAEIKETLVNNTVYSVNPKWNNESAVYTLADGTLRAKGWDAKESHEGSGKWFVNDSGQYCEQFSGDWDRGERCFSVYPGNTKDEIIMILESGWKSKAYPDGIYNLTIISGNKYNL